jgi:hypothetical protein
MKHCLGHSTPSIRRVSILGLILLLSLSSCSKKRGSALLEGPANPGVIIAKMQEAELNYEWLSAKLSTELLTTDKKQSFKANLRMRKDSIIWLSISPALGIEVARVILTPDSLKVIDKWNDTYYLGNYSLIESKMAITFDFKLLQDMIVGNPVLFDETEKFKGSKDDGAYLLTSKSSSKVRRAAELLNTGDTGNQDSLIIDENAHTEILERFNEDEEALTLKRYWVRSEDAKLMRCIITDLLNLRSIEAEYSGFTALESQLIPTSVEYAFTDRNSGTTMTMDYSRIKLNDITTFPFSIPEKFKPMEL